MTDIQKETVAAVFIELDNSISVQSLSKEVAGSQIIKVEDRVFISFMIENDGSNGTNEFSFPILIESRSKEDVLMAAKETAPPAKPKGKKKRSK